MKPHVNVSLDAQHFEDIEGDEYDDEPLNAEDEESFSRLDSITMYGICHFSILSDLSFVY